jgi:hypothetical protein
MPLKQEDALITGLATLAVVGAVYQLHLPTVAGARASDNGPGAAGNVHLSSARKSASIIAVGVVAAISLLSKSPTVFLIGGAGVIAFDFSHRLANATDKQSGQIPTVAPDATAAPVSG